MNRLTLIIELYYDAEQMHGDDPEGKRWFLDDILGDEDGLILHSNEIGDTIGRIIVREHVSDPINTGIASQDHATKPAAPPYNRHRDV